MPMHIPALVPVVPPDLYSLIITVIAGALIGGGGWKLYCFVSRNGLSHFKVPRRFHLRTLLILLAIAPPALAGFWYVGSLVALQIVVQTPIVDPRFQVPLRTDFEIVPIDPRRTSDVLNEK
jgi:hypothetical protein